MQESRSTEPGPGVQNHPTNNGDSPRTLEYDTKENDVPSTIADAPELERLERYAGPPIMSLSEANTDLGDDSGYEIAATLERHLSTLAAAEETSMASPSEEQLPDHDILSRNGGTDTPPGSVGLGRETGLLSLPMREGTADGALDADGHLHRMDRFSLYETSTRYYLVGGDVSNANFRVLKIDRTGPPGQLSIVEDDTVYSKGEMNELLNTIDDGNKNSGRLKLTCNGWGVLGFIRFTEAYYMLLITKKQQVAMIGGRFIYQVDGTELIALTTGASTKYHTDRNQEEGRYLTILNNLDLHRSFYFSNGYNVTQTMQHNTIHDRESQLSGMSNSNSNDFNDMFVWNHHLLDPAMQHFKNPFNWCIPIIHGFVDQSCVDMFGRSIYITLIARRSRFFAGARFLKRGANDLGYVANDVETEQIVTEMATTSLNAPVHRLLKNPSYTSFVQHRGSIPLHWTQDNTGVSPKPAIDLNFIDPYYSSAALHFDNLFERYGAPVAVLNLVRARERTPRESKLLVEYQNALAYLNQSLPDDKKIMYRAFDMAKAAKTRGQDVIGSLETIAQDLVTATGFFHNGVTLSNETSVQNGVTRSNCIDCLDRTNACQFVIGKKAFALQLQALGLIAGDTVDYDSDASNILAHMYNDHGDTLANQYGGSHLVNTTDSYRKINNWQSHSRDMLESFKRYYHNSFLDSQRQEAYNLFLGNYRYASGQPMLWELPSDYYLHHANPRSYGDINRRDYYQWFTPKFLEKRTLPMPRISPDHRPASLGVVESDWWNEYYKPGQLTSFVKLFAYRMNSTTRYLPKPSSTANFDRSPFVVRRKSHESIATDVAQSNDVSSQSRGEQRGSKRITSLQQWLHDSKRHDETARKEYVEKILNKGEYETAPKDTKRSPPPADKNLKNQWTLRQFYDDSLNPTVMEDEAREYRRYVSHPLRGALVLSSEPKHDSTTLDFEEYLETADRIGNAAHDFETLNGAVEYERWLNDVPDNVLDATEEDLEKKRYQAYRKWLRGKSLFKQSKVDPEYEHQA